MKIFIWENDGISDAYHDDGTLVMLAETAEQARELALAMNKARHDAIRETQRKQDEFHRKHNIANNRHFYISMMTPEQQAEYRAIFAGEYPESAFDGRDEAIARPPDRVIELDKPCLVAFNGGGYD